MSVVVVVLGLVMALAAAVRSTWSPCGLSMLSQITPVAEAGRRQKFGRTAGWFVAGSVIGGLTLGAAMAGGALAVAAVGLDYGSALALVVAGAFLGAAIDAHVFGFGPPFLRRQVNEDWLSTYRPWVYGGGFGWQIGVGLTTYVMTAAVPLMIVIGALTANAWAALAIGVTFGLVRGLAVLVGAPARTLPALYALHRRFEARAEPVRRAVIGVQLAVAAVAAWIVTPPFVAVGLSVVAAALLAVATATPASDARNIARKGPLESGNLGA